MTSRERVKKTIYFQKPDRIPHYLPDGQENDLLWLAPWTVGLEPGPKEKQPWTNYGRIDKRIDHWGVVWKRSAGKEGDLGQAKEYPIKNIAQHLDFQFPDLNNPEYYQKYKDAIEKNNNSDNPKYVLGVLGFSSLNEGIHNIIGLEKMFLSYYENPKVLKELIQRFSEKQRESIKLMAEIGCDGIMAYDDWGLQNRLMISLELIEEFFLPFYQQNWQLAHKFGLDIWLHSCGYIIDLLPHFIDARLNVIQMDQQENIGLENLSEKVGGRLAFWCPVDIQQVLAKGSQVEVENYVKKMINTLGGHNGGLISMAYSSPKAINLKHKNINAMCKAFRKYGVYS